MDFITALLTSNGNDALWVIIDRLTKMGHFVACKGTMKPEDLADHFIQQVISPTDCQQALYQTEDRYLL